MTKSIRRQFADIAARLEDLHAIAAEGQRANNSRDMQAVLAFHLRSGIAAIDGDTRIIAKALDRGNQS